jgi:hypothetical protein
MPPVNERIMVYVRQVQADKSYTVNKISEH